jgi:biotin synthase
MLSWLDEKDPRRLEELFREARACAIRYVGPKVYFRGIIEFSNLCGKDCYYCGIRKSNARVTRFSMGEGEILECAMAAQEMDYGSIVLQSGERRDETYVRFIEDVLRKIKAATSGKLGITLSLGEQTSETYERWFRAGAHRYLLRIETSSPGLYKKLHPEDHSFETRRECLQILRRTGYQVGTGVMIGLPGQSHEDLAEDLKFFTREDVDMIGMGPYVPHGDAPLGKGDSPLKGLRGTIPFSQDPAENLRLGLVMIALARLTLKDVNIAAATALQTLDPSGREKGVLAGANIIMPNITPALYRKHYQLYDGKPCLDENALQCRSCLERRIHASGAEVGYGEWGDSVHALKKKPKSST